MNKIGIYHLFGGNVKAKESFLAYCRTCDELCENDVENIEKALYLLIVDNTAQYLYFHTGNILGWLEKNGYYIELLLLSNFNYVTVGKYKNTESKRQENLHVSTGVNSRVRALELGIIASIKDLENRI